MTSIGSFSKQIPYNNNYFRVIPALVAGKDPITEVPYPISSFMYTLTSQGLTGFIPQSDSVQLSLCTGQALLRDMGVNYISTTIDGGQQVFRRVQVQAIGGISGSIAGNDSDYDCAYIAMGFNGLVPGIGYGPFIRTG
jgi:hypothetical protein